MADDEDNEAESRWSRIGPVVIGSLLAGGLTLAGTLAGALATNSANKDAARINRVMPAYASYLGAADAYVTFKERQIGTPACESVPVETVEERVLYDQFQQAKNEAELLLTQAAGDEFAEFNGATEAYSKSDTRIWAAPVRKDGSVQDIPKGPNEPRWSVCLDGPRNTDYDGSRLAFVNAARNENDLDPLPTPTSP